MSEETQTIGDGLEVEVSEVAIGDYSTTYGHVEAIADISGYRVLTFVNGATVRLANDELIKIVNGGRFDHGR